MHTWRTTRSATRPFRCRTGTERVGGRALPSSIGRNALPSRLGRDHVLRPTKTAQSLSDPPTDENAPASRLSAMSVCSVSNEANEAVHLLVAILLQAGHPSPLLRLARLSPPLPPPSPTWYICITASRRLERGRQPPAASARERERTHTRGREGDSRKQRQRKRTRISGAQTQARQSPRAPSYYRCRRTLCSLWKRTLSSILRNDTPLSSTTTTPSSRSSSCGQRYPSGLPLP